MRSIAIDLPAHGESGGAPAPLERSPLGCTSCSTRWRSSGRSSSGTRCRAGWPAIYAAAYPTRGLVVVDNGPHIRPFAELVHRLEPALRGPGFAEVWPTFENSLGLERIPEPVRSLVLDTHEVNQDVVVGYWETAAAQPIRPSSRRGSTRQIRKLDVPCLGVFGRPITDGERERFASAAGRAARGVGGRRPLRPSRRSRPLRHPAAPVRRPLHRYWLIAPNPDQDPRAATAVETSLADGYAPGWIRLPQGRCHPGQRTVGVPGTGSRSS